MANKKISNRASEFAKKLVPLWIEADKPIINYPITPKQLTEDWNGDREFREVIKSSGYTDKQKSLMLDCLDLCIAEKEDLLTHYKQSTFSQEIVGIYRKEIAKLADIDYRNYTVTPLCFFTPNRYLQAKLNESLKENLSQDRVKINQDFIDKILSTAIKIIENQGNTAKDIYAKTVTLELLTGRRCYSEVLTGANFRVYSDHELIFTGQAKGDKEKREKEYIIPVLGITPNQAIKTLEDIRGYIKSRPWYSEDLESKDIKQKVSGEIDKAIMINYLKHFVNLEMKEKVTSHTFRKLYATISHYKLAPEKSFTQYIATILGHDFVSKTGQVMSKTDTSEHYDMFYIG